MGTRLWLAVMTAALCAACGNTNDARREVQAALESALAKTAPPPYVAGDAEGKRLWAQTREFYERRAHEPAWFRGTVPRSEMSDLIKALQSAEEEGLDPELYSVSALEEWRDEGEEGFLIRRGLEPAAAAQLDPWLSYLYLKYASDLATGLSDLAHADRRWQIRPERFDARTHLEEALERGRIRAALLDLRPDFPQYLALKDALAGYRALGAEGGWPEVPHDLRLKRGESSPAAGLLAERLAASGDYTGRLRKKGEAIEFDEALQDAVQRFQRRHGLTADGIPGRATIAQLNIPVEQRIAQIELNLERWRWLPRDLGERYILVNIPEYHLEVWQGDRVQLAMPVVVGRPDTPTPIFNSDVSYIVFSPYWYVPPGIAEGETLPAVLRDPDFLARNDMEVLDTGGRVVDPATIDLTDPARYRFRQRPGRQNSLGLVKFMFPNEHHVYLHDTPADSLFARVSRSFSHGCVRVADPKALAEYLLAEERAWTPDRIEDAMHSGEERTVHLPEPVPVYLGYWTARVSADGDLQFRNDVYGIDRRQAALLAERIARLRKAAQAAVAAISGPGSLNERSTD
jgi:L,D-transpeptidase YcbB